MQQTHSRDVEEMFESIARTKVCLSGTIATPVNFKGSILQTLNMKIRLVDIAQDEYNCFLVQQGTR